MAVPVNTFTSPVAIGNREDLSDELSRLEPEKTPFYSNIGKATASATFTEWQLESLEDVDDNNVHAEGDDTAIQESQNRVRVGNQTQIFKKSVSVSGTQQAVTTAAVADEYDHQKALKMIALRRDKERAMLSKRGSNKQGEDSTGAAVPNVNGAPAGRRMGGAQAWITTNVSRGVGGANGGFSAGNVQAPVAGAPRPFTEDLLKEGLESRFNNVGDASPNLTAYMSSGLKEVFAGFAGLSETRDKATRSNKRVIYGAVDIYMGNFGTINAVPHAYGLDGDEVLIVDHAYFKKSSLRGTFTEPLANTGDTMKSQIISECTLKCLNEESAVLIADLAA